MSAGVLFSLEYKQLGLNWETMNYIIFGYKVKTAIYWNLVVAAGSLALGIYLEQILPKEYGSSKPWNFLCKRKHKMTLEEQDKERMQYAEAAKR
jgi:hypothetical protein